jgi:hypothetical protein
MPVAGSVAVKLRADEIVAAGRPIGAEETASAARPAPSAGQGFMEAVRAAQAALIAAPGPQPDRHQAQAHCPSSAGSPGPRIWMGVATSGLRRGACPGNRAKI